MDDTKLTEEQKKLVEDNYNLIYMMIHRYGVDRTHDDPEGILALALCNAAKTYDPSKGPFSTYACVCMLRSTRYEYRKNNKCVRTVDNVRYVTNGNSVDDDPDISVFEFIQDPVNTMSMVEILDVSENVLSEFKPIDAQVVRMYIYMGLTMEEIADHFGFSSKTSVYQKVKRYRKKMEEYRCDLLN